MATVEIIKRRRRIRMRFRGIVRVIISRNLAEVELENEEFTDNLKKNIITFIRRQTPFSMLTKEERCIIGRPRWVRTNDERRKLLNLITSLQCFNNYPPKIRARITPYLYFMRLEPGRILIKEGHDPKTLYFVLNGECVYSRIEYDGTTNQMVNKNMFIAGPGDIVGLHALIKKVKRFKTVTVLKLMEVLSLDADDFYKYLYPSAKFQYDQIVTAINKFEILRNFTDQQKYYAIQYGVLKEFQPMETIYCQDNTGMQYTYFILNGQCMILHSLKIRIKVLDNGKKICQLCDDKVQKEIEVENEEFVMKSTNVQLSTPGRKRVASIRISTSHLSEIDDSIQQPTSKSTFISACPMEGAEAARRAIDENAIDMPDEDSEEGEESQPDESKPYGTEPNENDPKSVNISKKIKQPWKYETHFIDIGTLSFGSIFSLGESMVRRSIMARTVVQCYMLPRFWLLDKPQNPGNIWQQMKFHLDSTIPSEEKLFDDYLATQKWEKFKTDYVNSLLRPENLTCKTQDIPVYCRIIESGVEE